MAEHQPTLEYFTDPIELFVWVNPKSLLGGLTLQMRSEFFSYPQQADQPQLPFVPNPTLPLGDIAPFALGALRNYVIEYNLERRRFEKFRDYPSRMTAMFMLDSFATAQSYLQRNRDHVGNRVLMRATTVGPGVKSMHDSSWIEFLKEDQMFPSETIDQVSDAYWSGQRVQDCEIGTLQGRWTREAIFETLVVGRVRLSEMTT